MVLLRRGDSGRDVRELQARLAQIGWFDHGVTGYFGPITDQAVAGFQAKRELPVTGMVDLSTWSRLLGMTREPTHGEIYPATVPRPSTAALDPRCETGRAMCIDKTERRLHWVVDGAVRLSFDVRFGSEYTPTREGQFAVYAKDRDHVSQLYGSSMPFSMFFSGGQAVHFSYDFAAKGYSGASHGCINTRDWDLTERLYDDVRIGDAVVIYWS